MGLKEIVDNYKTIQETKTSILSTIITNNAIAWFDDLLPELVKDGNVVERPDGITIAVIYHDVVGEIAMTVDGTAVLRFMGPSPNKSSKIDLPFFIWGKDRYATPVNHEDLAKLLLEVFPE